MPTYEYECRKCGNRFDAVQAFSDPALTTCEICTGPLKKVYGSVGIVFKGSGFYKTDSRATKTSATTANTPKTSEGTKSDQSTTESPKSSGGEAPAPSSKPEPAATP